LSGAVVAAFFAARLAAAALGSAWSPLPSVAPPGHALTAWVLVSGMALLALLLWLVLRHDAEAVWLSSAGGDGGVLAPRADLERPLATTVGRAHADVLRAQVDLRARGAALRARVTVWTRPLADPEAVGAAADAAVRHEAERLTGRDLDHVGVRVRVLKVGQLVRYLP